MKKSAMICSLGVATTLSMGIFAVTNPVMAESLLPLNRNTNGTSAEVKVKVTVVGQAPSVIINGPLDGSDNGDSTFSVEVIYSKSTQLVYELIYVNEDGTKTTYNLPPHSVSTGGTGDGTDRFDIDINNYGGKPGEYILNVRADGAGATTDSVRFTVSPFDFKFAGHEEKTNNPIIDFGKNSTVDYALVQVFDKNGKAILDEPIKVKIDPTKASKITLPFAEYGLTDGTYTVVATPYDKDGNIAGKNITHAITYASAPAPEVPNTGTFFAAMNLSRQDLLSTGLSLLFIGGFFGILIISKRNKSQKRR